ncbi:MAG TPA: hypothetical protein VNS09_06935 [Solirubrobacter sp.]|nr:hypothetical protein [Solirubrobacter sp.]
MRLIAILALLLAGCGSLPAASLPPPAGAAGPLAAGAFSIEPAHDRLRRADGASTATGREPTAIVLVDRGTKVAVLCGRERVLELYDARTLARLGRAGAGIGPTAVTTDGAELLWVTDVRGDALLVFHLRPRFELIRRVAVPGGPRAVAFDRGTLTIALREGVVHYVAGSRPVLRTR